MVARERRAIYVNGLDAIVSRDASWRTCFPTFRVDQHQRVNRPVASHLIPCLTYRQGSSVAADHITWIFVSFWHALVMKITCQGLGDRLKSGNQSNLVWKYRAVYINQSFQYAAAASSQSRPSSELWKLCHTSDPESELPSFIVSESEGGGEEKLVVRGRGVGMSICWDHSSTRG